LRGRPGVSLGPEILRFGKVRISPIVSGST
jgi:hypothetical protein